MQEPLFATYGIVKDHFWKEVKALPEIYARRGTRVFSDTIYLNHLISYMKNGRLKVLTNARLSELGKELLFYPGLPDLFQELHLEVALHASAWNLQSSRY